MTSRPVSGRRCGCPPSVSPPPAPRHRCGLQVVTAAPVPRRRHRGRGRGWPPSDRSRAFDSMVPPVLPSGMRAFSNRHANYLLVSCVAPFSFDVPPPDGSIRSSFGSTVLLPSS
jgi:hypothetical protein